MALSLVLVPLATALPETMSAMIWAFKGGRGGTLSVGALIGEQVVFSTLYPAVFLLTVGFPVGTAIEWSVTVTTLSSLILLPPRIEAQNTCRRPLHGIGALHCLSDSYDPFMKP